MEFLVTDLETRVRSTTKESWVPLTIKELKFHRKLEETLETIQFNIQQMASIVQLENSHPLNVPLHFKVQLDRKLNENQWKTAIHADMNAIQVEISTEHMHFIQNLLQSQISAFQRIKQLLVCFPLFEISLKFPKAEPTPAETLTVMTPVPETPSTTLSQMEEIETTIVRADEHIRKLQYALEKMNENESVKKTSFTSNDFNQSMVNLYSKLCSKI